MGHSLWPICFENLTQLYVLPGGLRHGETGATVEKLKSTIIFIAARKKVPKKQEPRTIFGNLLKENSDIISVIVYWIVYRSLVYSLKVYRFNNFYADVVFFSTLFPRYQTMPITKVRITVIGINNP